MKNMKKLLIILFGFIGLHDNAQASVLSSNNCTYQNTVWTCPIQGGQSIKIGAQSIVVPAGKVIYGQMGSGMGLNRDFALYTCSSQEEAQACISNPSACKSKFMGEYPSTNSYILWYFGGQKSLTLKDREYFIFRAQ